MQDAQSLLTRTFSQECPTKTLPSLTELQEMANTGAEKFDYWDWYYQPGNSIRQFDEANGISLDRAETTGCPCFSADLSILNAGRQIASTYPTYFENRTLNKFVLNLYNYGKNRDMAQKALDVVKRYIDGFDEIVTMYGGGGLYFYSKERGSGKTFLSTILGNELSMRGHRVRWYSMTNLLQEIKAGYDRESSASSAEIINLCRNAEVLILDDIGVERQSSWVNETMYTILDWRLTQCKPTIFTSNHRPSELSYDERIIDRISRMTELVEMPEESIRKKLNARNPLGTFLGN